MNLNKTLFSCGFLITTGSAVLAGEPTNLYWGDTHLHTSYSFDAFLNKNQSSTPDTAFRWAKGQPVVHPYTKAKVSIGTPLDFLVVSDHAEGLGLVRAIVSESDELDSDLSIFGEIKRWFAKLILQHKIAQGKEKDLLQDLLPLKAEHPGTDPVQDPANVITAPVFGDLTKVRTSAWSDTIASAEKHNEPGKFTAFLGWEWSSTPTGANLHRIIISPNGAKEAKQYLPFGADQSQYPEDLWAWLDKTSVDTGSEFIAIPHNSNVSKGYMFPEVTLRGQPITVKYARTRMKWEPVAEITQIKGDSETHSELSPEDSFADFENYPFYLQKSAEEYKVHKSDYVRSALRTGLELEKKIGVNPYKFAVIGSTDSHSGLSSSEEDNFLGKFAHDSTPQTKRRPDMLGDTKVSGWNMSAAGLAAVWAKENTRDAIFAAFKRREVYATTGPRIAVRLFAGWGFSENAAQLENMAEIGYAQGVPMGGDLTRPSSADAKVQLLIRAVKDPVGGKLDRVQVVKGWLDSEGNSHEKVFNVAWSDDRLLDNNGELTAVGDTVNRNTAAYSNTIGATEFSTVWEDPTFNANQRSFYYVRVLQIPTPRHSLYDAVAAQIDIPEEGPEVIQERAYTTPIWYTP